MTRHRNTPCAYIYVYIKYIESATSGGAKKTGDRDAYIL